MRGYSSHNNNSFIVRVGILEVTVVVAKTVVVEVAKIATKY